MKKRDTYNFNIHELEMKAINNSSYKNIFVKYINGTSLVHNVPSATPIITINGREHYLSTWSDLSSDHNYPMEFVGDTTIIFDNDKIMIINKFNDSRTNEYVFEYNNVSMYNNKKYKNKYVILGHNIDSQMSPARRFY